MADVPTDPIIEQLRPLLPHAERVTLVVRISGKDHEYDASWLAALLPDAEPDTDRFEQQGR